MRARRRVPERPQHRRRRASAEQRRDAEHADDQANAAPWPRRPRPLRGSGVPRIISDAYGQHGTHQPSRKGLHDFFGAVLMVNTVPAMNSVGEFRNPLQTATSADISEQQSTRFAR
jgi:hypothetical protein